MKLLTCSLALSLVTLGGVVSAAPADPYATIERLELARSPGGNTLAAYLERGTPPVAARAALALGRTQKLLAADPLLAQTGNPDTGVRAVTVYALGLLAGTLAVKPPPEKAAGSRATPPPKMKAEVNVEVGGILAGITADRRDRAGTAIVAALDDGSDAVKAAALDAVRRFASKSALNATVAGRAFDKAAHMLRADPSPVLRGRAALAIGELGANPRLRPRTLAALTDAFSHEDDANARWHEMFALERRFPKDLPRATILAALADHAEIVRLQGIRGAARSGDKAHLADLEPLRSDPAWRVAEETREAILYLQTGKRTEHFTAIPDGVTTPSPEPSPASEPSALPRPDVTGKSARPSIASMTFAPHILPRTVAQMTGPAPGMHPRVRVVTTKGTFELVLYPEWAPSTVANFLNLTQRGYYDGLRWFRIVPDFVVQTGDPTESGDGDAGYAIPAEENPVEQDSGVISMGLNYDKNGPQRDSAGTQFYITLSPQLHLDLDFTVFGKVRSGFDVLGRLVESDKMIRVERIPDVRLDP